MFTLEHKSKSENEKIPGNQFVVRVLGKIAALEEILPEEVEAPVRNKELLKNPFFRFLE